MKNEAIKIHQEVAGDVPADKSVFIDNPDASGIDVVVNITDEDTGPGVGSVTVHIEGVDAYGVAYPILSGAALNAVATTVLRVGRGLTAAANLTANGQIPKRLRIRLARSANVFPMAMTISAGLIK